MGAAVGQVPEYVQMITEWVMEKAERPGPRQADPEHHRHPLPGPGRPRRQRRRRRADQHDQLADRRRTSTPGRRCPTSAARARTAATPVRRSSPSRSTWCRRSRPTRRSGSRSPASAASTTWRDAVDFLLLGATTVQVGTSVMHYGFRIIDDLVDGLSTYLRAKGLHSPSELVGKALPTITDWGQPGPGVPAARPDRRGDAASTATCATPPATTAPTRRSGSRARTGRRG